MSDLFDTIDESDYHIGPIYPAKMVSRLHPLRRRVQFLVYATLLLWIIFGFESTWEMFNPVFDAIWYNPIGFIPSMLNPEARAQLWGEMYKIYGTGNHWSAFVIYGEIAVVYSVLLERKGFTKSRNFFITCGVVMLNAGLFELVWNRLFSYYQGQWWTFTTSFPQFRNLLFFTYFQFMGLFAILVLRGYGYKPKITKTKILLVIITLATWLLWIYYPFHVDTLTVETDWGIWTNSRNFPQTMYAIDQIDDGKAWGYPYFVENNWIHLLNTFCKFITTVTIAALCLFDKEE